MLNIVQILKDFSQLFDPYFLEFLDGEEQAYRKINRHTLLLLNEIKRIFESGGKRLRPAQMYYSYLACGGKDKKNALKAAVASEMLHTFAVIHDDILDKSDTRRGFPTSHIFLEQVHKNNKFAGDGSHFGLSGAILTGDLALALADKALTNSPFPVSTIFKAKKLFDDLRTELVAGEFLDVYAEYSPESISEDYVIEILKYKSGFYTCGYPLRLGAVLAGARVKIERGLFEVGEKSGVAFQIQDDILGVFGSEKEIGKSVDSDLREGKKTLLVVKALKFSTPAQRKVLNKFMGNPAATHNDLNSVRQIIKETGALDYSRQKALRLVKTARSELISLPLNNPGKEFLINLTQFLLERKF